MRRLALTAALILSLQACTSTNNNASNEPAKPHADAKGGAQGAAAAPEGSKGGGGGFLNDLEKDFKKEDANFKMHGAPVVQNCRDDAKKLCAAVEKEPGKLVQCLKQNESKLMPPCKTALAEYAKTRK